MPSPLSFPERVGPAKVTTNDSVREDLKQTLRLRYPDYAGDTVGDFIDALLAVVNRGDVLGSIEWNVAQHGTGRLRIEFENGQVNIRERVSHAS
jgi:hypothetical protein